VGQSGWQQSRWGESVDLERRPSAMSLSDSPKKNLASED